MWDLPGPGLEPVSPAFGRRILNHCATREAQYSFIKGRSWSRFGGCWGLSPLFGLCCLLLKAVNSVWGCISCFASFSLSCAAWLRVLLEGGSEATLVVDLCHWTAEWLRNSSAHCWATVLLLQVTYPSCVSFFQHRIITCLIKVSWLKSNNSFCNIWLECVVYGAVMNLSSVGLDLASFSASWCWPQPHPSLYWLLPVSVCLRCLSLPAHLTSQACFSATEFKDSCWIPHLQWVVSISLLDQQNTGLPSFRIVLISSFIYARPLLVRTQAVCWDMDFLLMLQSAHHTVDSKSMFIKLKGQ